MTNGDPGPPLRGFRSRSQHEGLLVRLRIKRGGTTLCPNRGQLGSHTRRFRLVEQGCTTGGEGPATKTKGPRQCHGPCSASARLGVSRRRHNVSLQNGRVRRAPGGRSPAKGRATNCQEQFVAERDSAESEGRGPGKGRATTDNVGGESPADAARPGDDAEGVNLKNW